MIAFKTPIPKIVELMQKRTQAVYAAIQDGMVRGLRDFEAKMIKEQFSGRPGLKRVTGAAAKSWFITVTGTNDATVAKLSNRRDAWYVAAHEHLNFDGNVSPKTAKFLTVPLNPTAVRMRQDHKSLREVSRLMVFKSKKGGLILAEVYGAKGGKLQMKPMFLLKEKIFIPQRLHVRRDFKEYGWTYLRAAVYKAVDKAISQGKIK